MTPCGRVHNRYRLRAQCDGREVILEVGEAAYRQIRSSGQLYKHVYDHELVLKLSEPRKFSNVRMSVPFERIIPPNVKNVVYESIAALWKCEESAQSPAGQIFDFEQAIGNAINEGAKRILTPGFIADPSRYPHKCPRCSAPAYIGLMSVDCSRKSCS